jgi:hypothetical protein
VPNRPDLTDTDPMGFEPVTDEGDQAADTEYIDESEGRYSLADSIRLRLLAATDSSRSAAGIFGAGDIMAIIIVPISLTITVMLVLAPFYRWVPWYVYLLTPVIGLVVGIVNIRGTYKRKVEQTPTETQALVEYDPMRVWVGAGTLWSVRHKLVIDPEKPEASERFIHALFRQHSSKLFVDMVRPLLLLAIWSSAGTVRAFDYTPLALVPLCLWLMSYIAIRFGEMRRRLKREKNLEYSTKDYRIRRREYFREFIRKMFGGVLAVGLVGGLLYLSPSLPTNVPPLAWTLSLLVIAVWMFFKGVDWWSLLFLVTDKNIVLPRVYPAWMWWKMSDAPHLPISRIQFSAHQDQSVVGNLFGYGIVVLDGLTALDAVYNQLEYVPRHEEVANRISRLSQRHQR